VSSVKGRLQNNAEHMHYHECLLLVEVKLCSLLPAAECKKVIRNYRPSKAAKWQSFCRKDLFIGNWLAKAGLISVAIP